MSCAGALLTTPHPPHSLVPAQVLSAASNSPSDLYLPFIAKLQHTVRDDIADCSSAAYETLPVPAALRILKLEGGAAALQAYSESRDLGWTIEGDKVVFAPANKTRAALDSSTLVGNILNYANELERIV